MGSVRTKDGLERWAQGQVNEISRKPHIFVKSCDVHFWEAVLSVR